MSRKIELFRKSVLPARGPARTAPQYVSIVCPSPPGLQTASSQIRANTSAKSVLYRLLDAGKQPRGASIVGRVGGSASPASRPLKRPRRLLTRRRVRASPSQLLLTALNSPLRTLSHPPGRRSGYFEQRGRTSGRFGRHHGAGAPRSGCGTPPRSVLHGPRLTVHPRSLSGRKELSFHGRLVHEGPALRRPVPLLLDALRAVPDRPALVRGVVRRARSTLLLSGAGTAST